MAEDSKKYMLAEYLEKLSSLWYKELVSSFDLKQISDEEYKGLGYLNDYYSLKKSLAENKIEYFKFMIRSCLSRRVKSVSKRSNGDTLFSYIYEIIDDNKRRNILLNYFLDSMSIPRICKTHNISESSVHRVIRSAKDKLNSEAR